MPDLASSDSSSVVSDLPTPEVFFSDHIEEMSDIAQDLYVEARCTCSPCIARQETPLLRIKKCGDFTHFECLIHKVTRLQPDHLKCPACGVQLMQKEILPIKNMADMYGIDVEQERLPRPITQFGDTLKTVENMHEQEVKLMRVVIDSFLRVEFYQSMLRSSKVNFVEAFEKMIAKMKELGLPFGTKYFDINLEIESDACDWEIGIVDFVVERARELCPACDNTTELQVLMTYQMELQDLAEEARNDEAANRKGMADL
ncbi:hypothetical protein P154DRAFT_575714 [Amniculicola lignicola CBS 123094]|uniref:Uncharacterized protein n=1 Tax=Amniculicola lignicola CBS 123094 TaxID=1392246 RepID=A0A6A5WI01_9PLEO|nr:hypothetical protein P154DRAFT_575714 [Amniculicola lignicola CBS 123094]